MTLPKVPAEAVQATNDAVSEVIGGAGVSQARREASDDRYKRREVRPLKLQRSAQLLHWPGQAKILPPLQRSGTQQANLYCLKLLPMAECGVVALQSGLLPFLRAHSSSNVSADAPREFVCED